MPPQVVPNSPADTYTKIVLVAFLRRLREFDDARKVAMAERMSNLILGGICSSRHHQVKRINGSWVKVDDVASSVPASSGGHGTTDELPINRGTSTGGVRQRFPRPAAP